MLKMQVIGNLAKDAVVRHWNGKQAISFNVAYNEKYKDQDGTKHERTTWVNCTLWREGETKLTNYLKKGQKVFLEGLPKVSTYVSKTTGEVIPDLQLNVRELHLLGGNNNDQQPAPQPNQQSTQQQPVQQQAPAPPVTSANTSDQTVPWEQ